MSCGLPLRDSKGKLGDVRGADTSDLGYHINSSGKKGQAVERVAKSKPSSVTHLKVGPALEKRASKKKSLKRYSTEGLRHIQPQE